MTYIKANIGGEILIVSDVAGYIAEPTAIVENIPEDFYQYIQKYRIVDGKLEYILYPIPEHENIYTMIQPCPVRPDLIVKIWDSNYQNDKEAKVITINVTAIHFDEQGDRVPQYDGKSYVLADMSEDHKVEVAPDVWEYSYVLANTMFDNGQPINQLIHQAIQIADADGSLNKRLYNL